MQRRPVAIKFPDRPNYFKYKLESGKELYFRLPFFQTAAAIMQYLEQFKFVADAGVLSKVAISEEVAAGVIGICWFHPEYSLDYRFKDFGDVSEYGFAVVEELYSGAEGFEPLEFGELIEIMPILSKKIGDTFVKEIDIKKKSGLLKEIPSPAKSSTKFESDSSISNTPKGISG